jgi:hypothetical protein
MLQSLYILFTCENEATAAADDDEIVVTSQNMQIRPAFLLVLILNTDPKYVNFT